MNNLNLPSDLHEFLSNGRELNYDPSSIEPGFVGLKSIDKLEIGEIWIRSDESPFEQEDPNSGKDGFYTVPAISLTGECEAYDPDFILLWLPNEKQFGTWDCDHWALYTFSDVTWSDIVNDPTKFLDAQWNDFERKHSAYFKPFPKYEFKEGMPF